jgi:hypothetical protein
MATPRMADTHCSSRPDGNMATAMWPAPLGRAFVRAGVCARPTHRSLGERFFRRMLDNPADRATLSTSVDTNTTFVWRNCSKPDLPVPAYARRDIVDEDRVGVYHCIARCVRRAFLCGTDSYTGRDYGHRKAWVLDRLRQLAGLFGVEVCDYAIMSNHWTGREIRENKCGAIPDNLAPILDRLGLDRSNWVKTVREFGRMFKQAAGRASSLARAAPGCSRRWFQGRTAAQAAFL